MRFFRSEPMLYLSGFIMIASLITITANLLVASGDSTISKRSATMRLLTPPSAEIR